VQANLFAGFWPLIQFFDLFSTLLVTSSSVTAPFSDLLPSFNALSHLLWMNKLQLCVHAPEAAKVKSPLTRQLLSSLRCISLENVLQQKQSLMLNVEARNRRTLRTLRTTSASQPRT
jgi:hypothetical protein